MSVLRSPSIIQGGTHSDDRGQIKFVNEFDMSEVKRMYMTTPTIANPWRAWQGHKIEQKWFYCTRGRFEVYTVKPDNWENPSKDLEISMFELEDQSSKILHVPSGYINGFKSLQANSSIMIYSDFTVSESKADDFRYEVDYWNTKVFIKNK